MADSLERAAGAGAEIELGGKKYPIKPFVIGDYVALRENIKSKRIRDFRKAAEGMEPDERRKIMVELASQTISETELIEESSTPEGLMFMLWRLILKTDPQATLEGMDALLDKEDINDLMAMAEGLNAAEEGVPVNPPIQEGTG